MAHELVHTLQQTEGARWVRPDDTPAALEAEAGHLGRLAARGRPLPPRRRDDGPQAPRLQGHDSFLVDMDQFRPVIGDFLREM